MALLHRSYRVLCGAHGAYKRWYSCISHIGSSAVRKKTARASGSVLAARWPQTGEVTGWMSRSFQFLSKTLRTFRATAGKSKTAVKSEHACVASTYPQWKQDTRAHLRGCLETSGGKNVTPDVMRGLKAFATKAGFDKKNSQAAMQIAAFVKKNEYEEAGPQAIRLRGDEQLKATDVTVLLRMYQDV